MTQRRWSWDGVLMAIAVAGMFFGALVSVAANATDSSALYQLAALLFFGGLGWVILRGFRHILSGFF